MDAKQETMILFLKWLTISMEAQQLKQGAEHSSRNLCFEDQVLGSDKSDGKTQEMDFEQSFLCCRGGKARSRFLVEQTSWRKLHVT